MSLEKKIEEIEKNLCKIIEKEDIKFYAEEAEDITYSLEDRDKELKDARKIGIPLNDYFENRIFLGRVSDTEEVGVMITEELESGIINLERRGDFEDISKEELSEKGPVLESIYDSVKDYLSGNLSHVQAVYTNSLEKPEVATLYTGCNSE